jgi:uncharacterized protein
MLLPLVWAACAAAGYLYSLQQHIPQATVLAAFPAFLMEATFFYFLGVEKARTRIEKIGPTIAFALTAAALAPYLAASLALGSFSLRSFLWLAALAVAASFWYVFLPRSPVSDLFFLFLMAIVMLTRIFSQIYVSPHPKLPLYVLGQAMWIRTGAFAMLSVRGISGVGFGFWPEKREWKIGALYFLAFVPIAAVLAWWLGFAKPRWPAFGWEKASLVTIGTFFGVLWVLALGEEFFFRGLLQQWMTSWLGNEWAGLAVTSLLFGSAHLWFRQFPNWRFASLAALAGVFYGLAFRQARSIRASMVTHALVVTTWRVFFS